MLRTMNRGLLFSCFPCGISRSQEPGWLPRKGPRRLADNGAAFGISLDTSRKVLLLWNLRQRRKRHQWRWNWQ